MLGTDYPHSFAVSVIGFIVSFAKEIVWIERCLKVFIACNLIDEKRWLKLEMSFQMLTIISKHESQRIHPSTHHFQYSIE